MFYANLSFFVRRSYVIVLRHFFRTTHGLMWPSFKPVQRGGSYHEGKPRRENGSEDQDQAQEQGIQLAADDAGEKK